MYLKLIVKSFSLNPLNFSNEITQIMNLLNFKIDALNVSYKNRNLYREELFWKISL